MHVCRRFIKDLTGIYGFWGFTFYLRDDAPLQNIDEEICIMSMRIRNFARSEVDDFDHTFLPRKVGKLFGHQSCCFSGPCIGASKWSCGAKCEQQRERYSVHCLSLSFRVGWFQAVARPTWPRIPTRLAMGQALQGGAKFGFRTPNEPRKLLRHVDDLDLSKLFQPFPTQFGADT
jgi:hypothetical protein